MNRQDIIEAASAYVEKLLSEQLPEGYNYHKFKHTSFVVKEAERLAAENGLNKEDTELLLLAAWFHDTGYIQGFKDHEEKSISIASDFLKQHGYDASKIERITQLIRETKMPQTPQTLPGKILCDADLSGLGSEDYFKISKQLRKELRNTQSKEFSDDEWIKQEIEWMESHRYFTPAAQKLYGAQKEKNIAALRELIRTGTQPKEAPFMNHTDGDMVEKKKKKKKKEEEFSRGVETMFRTSTRTHINLSAMADSKANIMLSINAIVISITVSALLPKLETSSNLIIPSILLLATCLLTIVFATLSTKPKVTSGRFTRDDIEQKRSNLLFFGNFYNMELEDFEWGMSRMMRDKEFLYSSMSKDLYYLGKVLAKKYKYLRICYNIFMYGLIVSVIAFALALISF